MKSTALLKDTLREIKKSFGRFISIFAIVGIGVAFFAGVKDSVPVMKNTADSYFDDYNFMDLKIMSTMGLTSDDIENVKKTDGVTGIYGSHSMDVLSMQHNQQRVFKLLSMPLKAAPSDKNYINQTRLVKGRLPEKADECVIEFTKIRGSDTKIGDRITFTSGSDDALSDSLQNVTYTIVGEVTIPYYLSFEKGSSTIGSGQINNYAVIPEDNFKQEYYSEAFVTIEGAKDKNSYDDSYFDIIEPVKHKVTDVGKEQAAKRFLDVQTTAKSSLEDGRTEYIANKNKYDKEIAKARKVLQDSERDLQQAEGTLISEKTNTYAMLDAKAAELQGAVDTQSQLQNLYVQNEPVYLASKQSFELAYPAMQEKLVSLQQNLQQLQTTLADIETQLMNPLLSDEQRTQLLGQKEQLVTQIVGVTAGITEINTQISSAQQQLQKGKAELDQLTQNIALLETSIQDGNVQLNEGRNKAEQEFSRAQQEIDNGRKEVEQGNIKVTDEETQGALKLQDAKAKLDSAEAEILAVKEPSWYVLDRHSHYSYMDYGSAADRMGAIAKVFPLFFFLVAALVCLTTMTRMVDEQRQEIGTLKALGYSKPYIAMKFVIYASVASILGGIFGAFIGMIIFPTVIFNAWGIMYNLPDVRLYPDFGLALLSVGLASAITILSAIAACYKELMETPALLMRPKAPKNGKKILMESIPFIWKHFNFIHKVTARNIFRYKKRFLMTVIGISGCSALLVAGFGIRDSIGEIASKQYGEIFTFDVSLQFKADTSEKQKKDLLASLQADKNVKEATSVAIYHGLYSDDGEDKGIDIYVPGNLQVFDRFVNIRTRLGHQPITLPKDGVIITEKIAKMKRLAIGDNFAVNNGDGVKKKLKISGICENYVGHAIYMTPEYYKAIYHKSPVNTGLFADLKDTTKQQETQLGNRFMEKADIDSVTFYSTIATTFQQTISSLSIIVVVLIISAGLLAFVVLYNLTNVNISERLREIATIKVLGFYDKEVSAYVYRENIILTLVGGCCGLLLGIGLHSLIMSLAEMDTIMFGRNINLVSFLYSLLITMVFAIIVNLVMYRKLQKIPMVESLKSVE